MTKQAIVMNLKLPLKLLIASSCLFALNSSFAVNDNASERAKLVREYWSAERINAATPRDIVIDAKGQSFIRSPKGFKPYGTKTARPPEPLAKGGKGGGGSGGGNSGGSGGGGSASCGSLGDTEVQIMEPTSGSKINSLPFQVQAAVSDPQGIKSVSFKFQQAGNSTVEQITPNCSSQPEGVVNCSATITAISNGDWSWWVEGKDGGRRGGSSFSSCNDKVAFTADIQNSCGGGIVNDADWQCDGNIQTAAGRILFKMSDGDYVCSGTVVNDIATDRSVILTAAHCVYDDVDKQFAQMAMFIPNQAGTSGSSTDTDCTNDPLGCWPVSFGVVDQNWTATSWPDNIPWDYAYYVVENGGNQSAYGVTRADALDETVPPMDVTFAYPGADDDYTYALGYSYSQDPAFRYCAQNVQPMGTTNWFLDSCGLSGGASGGPWTQSTEGDLGTGPLMSVNSFGYTTRPGMGGPLLYNNSASCLFDAANNIDLASPGVVGCSP